METKQMNAKHTPGPLSVSSSVMVVNDEGKVLANCAPFLGMGLDSLGVTLEEASTNARLYAASPELLEALEYMIQWVDVPITDSNRKAMNKAIASADAVICKALGTYAKAEGRA